MRRFAPTLFAAALLFGGCVSVHREATEVRGATPAEPVDDLARAAACVEKGDSLGAMGHLKNHFRPDPRVTVFNADAATISQQLLGLGLAHCDYIVSGIPFSLIEPEKKRALLRATYDALAPEYHAAFVIYQITNELKENGHCDLFARVESEYCVQNIPPNFVTKFYRTLNGRGHHGANGSHNGANGSAKH